LLAAARSLFHREHTLAKAVDDISFTVEAGERVGFLGPNGAGKTTTLKLLAGLLHPTSGEVRVDGHVPQQRRDEFLKSIMLVMGQKQQLLWDLPPSDTFELNRAIYDVSAALYRQRVDGLVELLAIGDVINKPTRQLSLGERMKCELVASLIHGPKVLFLDEPTIGLDVSMQTVVRDFIRQHNETTGATLMLTSHYMDDVAALCPRVIVINHGKLTFDGKLESLVQQVRPDKRVLLRFERAVDDKDLESLGTLIENKPDFAVLRVTQAALSQTVSRALATLPVRDLTVENAPLEEVMSEMFARQATDQHGATGRPT
jgi:ABC-2 type transport system ATP-binding protein